MKTLVAYYSRTGTTKKVADAIAQKLNADAEEIEDTVDRSGARGYLISGRDAMKRRLTKLKPIKFNPAEYDLVIIGTPIWGWTMSVPVRAYITEQKDNFNNKVAFFCTMGGAGDKKAFKEMEEMIGKKPAAVFSATTRKVVKNEHIKSLENYIAILDS